MLSAADKAGIAAALKNIRDDRPTSIVIRRGKTTLPAQTVRIAKSKGIPGNTDSEALQAATTGIAVLGDLTLDIQPADRFSVGGQLYQVTNVHPNKDAAIMAEARLVQ